MTLAQLRYLLAIVDAGTNITLAAERVNATQPGLSKQLKQLEEYLGLMLFVRRGRSLVKLTAAGEEIVKRARIIVAEAADIRSLAANQRATSTGSLRIVTTPIQAQFVLPEALAALRARFPQVDVSLGFGADADDLDRRNPEADFIMFSTDGRVPEGGVAIPLYRWDPVAIVPESHPLAKAAVPTSLGALANYPLISYDTSRTAALAIARTFSDAGIAARFAYTVRDGSVIKAAVRQGLGVGMLAEMAFDPAVDRDLRAIPLAGVLPRCTTWAVLRRERVARDYTVALLNLLSGIKPIAIRRAAQPGSLDVDAAAVPMWTDVVARLRSHVSLRTAA